MGLFTWSQDTATALQITSVTEQLSWALRFSLSLYLQKIHANRQNTSKLRQHCQFDSTYVANTHETIKFAVLAPLHCQLCTQFGREGRERLKTIFAFKKRTKDVTWAILPYVAHHASFSSRRPTSHSVLQQVIPTKQSDWSTIECAQISMTARITHH